MQNINIGKSGIQVPFLGMGTWAIGGGSWWGDNDDSLSVKAIQTAVEDMKGNRLLLFTSDWAVRWAETHNENLQLSEFGNI